MGKGRKATGEYAELKAALTIRMPVELRKRLEAATKEGQRLRGNPKYKITQEVLRRLDESFDDHGSEPNSAIAGFQVAVAELLRNVAGFSSRDATVSPQIWDNPWYFKAFRVALNEFLDQIEPKGDAIAPDTKGMPPMLAEAFASPEARGKIAVSALLMSVQHSLSPDALKHHQILRAEGLKGNAFAKVRADREMRLLSVASFLKRN